MFLILLAFILILSGCTKTPDTSPETTLSSLPEAEESSLPSESAPEQEPSEELYNVSIVTIKTKDAFIEPTDEVFDLVLVKPEETVMSEEYQKVYDTFIDGTGYLLGKEFSEDYIPFSYLTDVYGACERKDFELLGIPKSDPGLDETFWLSSAEVEERLGRYFPWKKEDIRKAFGYDAETDQYVIPVGGGGPMFTYITDVEKEGDILKIHYSFYQDISFYEGIENPEFFPVYRKAILEIKQEEPLWKYYSNKFIYDCDFPTWHNSYYSLGASIKNYNFGTMAEYRIIKDSSVDLLTVHGISDHHFYMNQTPCGIFESSGGIWIYDFETEELRKITELPSKYNEKHVITYVGRDCENRIVVAYQCVSEDEYAPNIELAVLDYETHDVINYIDTEFTRGPNFSMGIDRDRNHSFLIYYHDIDKENIINYLE